MALSRPIFSGLIAGLAIALGAAGGWMAYQSTRVPNVELGRTSDDTIQVWSDTPDTAVTVQWVLRPDGQVLITATGVEGQPSPHAVHVLLWCDTQLASPGLWMSEGELSSTSFGEGCDGTAPATAQLLTFGVGESAYGTTIADWTDGASGQRVARSPRIVLSGTGESDETITGVNLDEFNSVQEQLPVDRFPVTSSSVLSVGLDADPAEIPDDTVPPDGSTEKLSVTIVTDEGLDTVPSVTWDLSFTSESPGRYGYTMQAGLARWTNPEGQTSAQTLLLLSGVALGLALSLIAELLFRLRKD